MGRYFKEIIIFIFLAIFIIILFAIAFYEYAPFKKNFSELEEYKRTSQTENVIQEIKLTSLESGESKSVIKSYSISASDLGKYESYEKGRENPFAEVKEEENVADTTGNSTSGNKKDNNTSSSTNTSEGLFKGTGTTK